MSASIASFGFRIWTKASSSSLVGASSILLATASLRSLTLPSQSLKASFREAERLLNSSIVRASSLSAFIFNAAMRVRKSDFVGTSSLFALRRIATDRPWKSAQHWPIFSMMPSVRSWNSALLVTSLDSALSFRASPRVRSLASVMARLVAAFRCMSPSCAWTSSFVGTADTSAFRSIASWTAPSSSLLGTSEVSALSCKDFLSTSCERWAAVAPSFTTCVKASTSLASAFSRATSMSSWMHTPLSRIVLCTPSR
mmetsp:Transcript_42586/g.92784  ORF Transcript_42586/g.92784 Transcript_42586/m.92784 type:complete len:255 (+) Transcript_42586:387-1151(+)